MKIKKIVIVISIILLMSIVAGIFIFFPATNKAAQIFSSSVSNSSLSSVPISISTSGLTSESISSPSLPDTSNTSSTVSSKATTVYEPICSKDPEGKYVALTYDDGPSLTNAEILLEAYKKYNAHATFFAVGTMVKNNPDTLKKLHDAGHEIGSHTYTHKSFAKLSDEEIRNEIKTCNDLIESIIGERPKLLRPPYGNIKMNISNELDMVITLWNVDTMDWKKRSKPALVNYVVSNAKDGDIILMHENVRSTAEAAEEILKGLTEKGFKVVTVSELFSRKGIAMETSRIYHHITN